jgi:Protein of unknown function (DUF2637)
MNADRVIRWSSALAVVGVAVLAAVVSYEHASALVRELGESGWTGRLIPLTVDGLIYASSMAMLDSARRKMPVPALARWLLGLGIAAMLAANVAHGWGTSLDDTTDSGDCGINCRGVGMGPRRSCRIGPRASVGRSLPQRCIAPCSGDTGRIGQKGPGRNGSGDD